MQIPSHFCVNRHKVKTFVLGADPTNFSDRGKSVALATVFGIGSSDNRYFRDIFINLKLIGLSLENIYVQNLIGEYLKFETSKNKKWEIIAEKWITWRKAEFDEIDKSRKKPVLVTAEQILKVLTDGDISRASHYYSMKSDIPIIQNKLGRPVIPFYRHYWYSLKRAKWKDYCERLKKYFSQNA